MIRLNRSDQIADNVVANHDLIASDSNKRSESTNGTVANVS
jgi:hypothetical protein